MKIICVQHVDFETPGVIEDWANSRSHSFQTLKPYRGDPFPDVTDIDFIISMGGPQSPREAKELAYLQDEIDFLKQATAKGKHVLGFCLGAQLIGEALGGNALKSPEKEIGVFPITLTDHGKEDPLFCDFPSSFPVIHWHNDIPGSTKESVLLASSEGCPVQAYRYGARIYGLQFHMEITKKGMEDLIFHAASDLSPSRFTQSQEELLQQDYEAINQRIPILLDRFVHI